VNPTGSVEVPLTFNGYVFCARHSVRMRADEVHEDDVLLLDGCMSRVSAVRRLGPLPQHGSDVIFLAGHENIARFPHEIVSVIRPSDVGDAAYVVGVHRRRIEAP
jgi:hypothetical protein